MHFLASPSSILFMSCRHLSIHSTVDAGSIRVAVIFLIKSRLTGDNNASLNTGTFSGSHISLGGSGIEEDESGDITKSHLTLYVISACVHRGILWG